MRKLILIIQLLAITIFSNGQVFSSSCIAHDSIIAKYISDADYLSLSKIYRRNLPLKDSVYISKTHSDTILNALIAVYNAVNSPAHDTVIKWLNIHNVSDGVLKWIGIMAPSNLSWMNQLKLKNIPTGNKSLDSILIKFNYKVDKYYEFGNVFTYHSVDLISDINYNTPAIANLVSKIPDIIDCSGSGMGGRGFFNQYIKDSIYPDHVELIYNYGWGDCPAGCIYWRSWKFKIFYNCSVEFVNSYGDIIELTNGINKNETKKISIYPNPFKEIIKIHGYENSEEISYELKNILGQEILSGRTVNNKIENLEGLAPGIYLLILKVNDEIVTFRVCKE